MAKDKITDWSTTAANNEDIGGIGILGTNFVSSGDNALRELMEQVAKVNAGTDPVADTWSFGDPGDLTKRARLDAGNVTAGQTRVIFAPDSNGTIAYRDADSNFTANQTITSTDAGATGNPILTLDRNSASPDDNDVLGAIRFNGRDDGANATTYATIFARALDVTDATEDGEVAIQVPVAGSQTEVFKVSGTAFTALGQTFSTLRSIKGIADISLTNGNTPAVPYCSFVDALTGAQTWEALGVGTSGAKLGLLNGNNAWSGTQTFSGQNDFGVYSGVGATAGKRFATTNYALLSSRTETTSVAHHAFYNPNGLVGQISTSGSATSYVTSSDENLKNFIGTYDPAEAIAIIRADPVRDFTWKSSGDYAVGWGAQTSYAVSPDLATPGVGEPGDDDFVPWGIDQSKRTPYLWAAVSKLLDEVDDLKARIAALEAA